jgi:XTP/dITP diphosphohydrolase
MNRPRLLIATNNAGKVEEIKTLLRDMNLDLASPAQIGLDLHVTEDGRTYADNAAKKASAFAEASGLVSMADDSGLEVDALGGAPGLYSARYSPRANASDADRRALLLKNLTGRPRPWTARFRATIAIALPGGPVQLADGECEGEIIPEERGTGGFGYDRIFFIPNVGRTMAELSMDEKNRLSHRARAVMNARSILDEISYRPGP